MNKKKLFLWAVLGCMMLAGLTACSVDDNTPDMPGDGVRVRRMTITETDDAAARQVLTRATLTEDDGLTASWTAGDGLTYCNLSRTNPSDEGVYSGALTATSSAATSQFTGDVTCNAGDYLAVVYPAATFETNESYTISLLPLRLWQSLRHICHRQHSRCHDGEDEEPAHCVQVLVCQ